MCECVWQESSFRLGEDVFTLNVNKFYKFRDFSAGCQDNAAINYFTRQQRKFISANLDGSYLVLVSAKIHRS